MCLCCRILAHSAETGDSLWMLDNAHAGGVTALVLSHNRRFLLSGGPAGEVRLWEMRSRELISHLKEHKQKVTALCLYEDDTLCLSGSRDRCILRWDLKSEVIKWCFLCVKDVCFYYHDSVLTYMLCLSSFFLIKNPPYFGLDARALPHAADGWDQ